MIIAEWRGGQRSANTATSDQPARVSQPVIAGGPGRDVGGNASRPTRPVAPIPGTIIFPSDAGQDVSVRVDRSGIHVRQNNTETVIPIRDVVPRGVVQMTYSLSFALVLCVIGFPIARALARWIDRRGVAPAVPTNLVERLASVESAIDTVAVEIERIGEGQRYAAKLMAERSHAVPR